MENIGVVKKYLGKIKGFREKETAFTEEPCKSCKNHFVKREVNADEAND